MASLLELHPAEPLWAQASYSCELGRSAVPVEYGAKCTHSQACMRGVRIRTRLGIPAYRVASERIRTSGG